MPLTSARSARQLVTIVEALIELVDRVASEDGAGHPTAGGEASARRHLLLTAKREYNARRERENLIGRELFADPGWDILLELYIAHLEGDRISKSSIGLEADLAQTTVARWTNLLMERQLIVGSQDAMDKRRVWMEPTPRCIRMMDTLFANRGIILEKLELERLRRLEQTTASPASNVLKFEEHRARRSAEHGPAELLERAELANPQLFELARRCEHASPDETGDLIMEASELLPLAIGGPMMPTATSNGGWAMLSGLAHSGAHESAVIRIMPKGYKFSSTSDETTLVCQVRATPEIVFTSSKAANLALGWLACLLRCAACMSGQGDVRDDHIKEGN